MGQGLKVEKLDERKAQQAFRWRRCNLCADEFQPRNAFERYCAGCKESSELLRFSEWLPELDAALTEKIPA